MGTSTLNNIKAFFVALSALFFLAPAQGEAQIVQKGVLSANSGAACDNKGVSIVLEYTAQVDKYAPDVAVPTTFQASGDYPYSIQLFEIRSDGTEVLRDEVNSANAVTGGFSPGGLIGKVDEKVYIGYKHSGNNKIYGGTGIQAVNQSTRLRQIDIYPKYFEWEDLGKTFMVRLNMKQKAQKVNFYRIVDLYFDVVGNGIDEGVVLEDKSAAYLAQDESWLLLPCKGSGPVTMTIGNSEYPYQDDEGNAKISALGNKYSVSYTWERTLDSWGRTNGVVASGNTCVDDEIASFTTSGQTVYVPSSAIYRNGTEIPSCFISVYPGYYTINYFTPLQLKSAFENITSGAKDTGNKFTVCYGDTVRYIPTFIQDIEGVETQCSDGEVYWKIEKLDEGGNVVEIVLDDHAYYADEAYEFENIKATATYRVTCEYIDPNGDNLGSIRVYGDLNGDHIGEENPCPTVEEFTIEVRQLPEGPSASYTKTVCAEDDNTIYAGIAKTNPDDATNYAYRFFYSDDQGLTYKPFDSGDYITSSNTDDWQNPVKPNDVVFTYQNVTYPFLDGTDTGEDYGTKLKYIRFEVANTYQIQGTTYFCPVQHDFSFGVNKLPVLKKVDEIFACKGQKVSFQVRLDESVQLPDPSTGDGMTYEVFLDEACTVKADNVVNLKGNKDNTVVPVLADAYENWSRFNGDDEEGTYAWFGLLKLDADYLKFYVRVKNEETGCYSHPVEVTIVARPIPDIDNLKADPAAFCQNADPAGLQVTAELSKTFTDFYAVRPPSLKPVVTYHWSWEDANAAALGSAETDDVNVLGDPKTNFSGLTAELGLAKVTVYATSSDGCGYELDFGGNPLVDNHITEDKTVDVEIKDLPYFDIQEGVQACADQGIVSVQVASTDERTLTFDFTPVTEDGITAPTPVTTSLTVAGNSSADFQTSVNTTDVKDVTVYKYDVTVTDNTTLACKDEATLSFKAYPVPELDITPAVDDRHLCQGQTFQINVTPSITEAENPGPATSYSYAWYIDGVAVATTQSYDWVTTTSTTPGVHNGSVTVTYTFTDGHTCSTTENFQIFVDAVPQISFKSDFTICEGYGTTLAGVVTNPDVANHTGTTNVYVPKVTVPDDPSVIVSPTEVNYYTWNFPVAPERTTIYKLTVENSTTGCVVPAEAEQSVTVTVKRKARVRLDKLSANEVCAGNNTIAIDYTHENDDESTLNLASLTVAGFTVVSYNSTQIVLQADLSEGTITFGQDIMSAETNEKCEVVFTNTLDLKVRPIPAVPTITRNPVDDFEACYRESKTFTFTVNDQKQGFKYEFYISPTKPTDGDTPIATTSYPNGRYSRNTQNDDGGVINVWVRSIDTNHPTNCPSDFAGPFPITIHKIQEPTCPAPATICEDETATLTVTAPLSDAAHKYTYEFFLGSTSKQNTESVSYTTDALSNTTTYYVRTHDQTTGCSSHEMTSVTVSVHKKPLGRTQITYNGVDGTPNISLPDGSVVKRSSFCRGEQGTAHIVVNAYDNDNNPLAHTSTLVAVSVGSLSDWTKVDDNTFTCNKIWDEEVELTFSVNDGSCTSNEFKATVKVVDPPAAPTIKLSLSEMCKGADLNLKLSVLPYTGKTNDINFVFYMHEKGSTAILKGPFTTKSGELTYKTVSDLDIQNDVEFTAYAYNIKTGCMSPVSTNLPGITVHPLPVPTVKADPEVLCPNEQSELTVVEDYVKYEWLDFDVKGQTTKSVTVTVPETRTYTVKVTDVNGCVSEVASVNVVVYPVPEFTVSVAPDVVCQGSDTRVEFTLTPKNDGVVDFKYPYTFWTEAPSTKSIQTTTDSEGNVTSYFVDGETWTEASVKFGFQITSTDAFNKCLSEEQTATVTVIPALATPVVYSYSAQDGSLTRDVHVCKGSTDSVKAFIDNVSAYPTADGTTYSYHWYTDAAGTNEITSGGEFTLAENGTTVSFVPSTTPTTLYAKVVRETEPKCESEISEVITVTIEDLPEPPVAIAPTIYICQPEQASETLELRVQSPASDYTYHWYRQNEGETDTDMSDDVEVATVKGSVTAVIPNPDETTYYYVIAESKYGCFSDSKSNIVTAEVGTNPVIVAVTAPQESVCTGDDINLTVGVEGSTDGITYRYEVVPSDGSFPTINGTSLDGNITLNLDADDTYTANITVWAVYANHCESLNNLTYDVDVRGLPTVKGTNLKASVCAESEFSFTLTEVTSHDLASCDDPSNAMLRVDLVDKNGNVLVSKTVFSGDDVEIVYSDGLKRDMLPLHYEIYDISSKWTDKCPRKKQLNVTLVDIPEFELVNNDGKVDETPDEDVLTIHYCVDESLNLGLKQPLPTNDPLGYPINYTYQWQYNGVDIVGQVSPSYTRDNLVPAYSGEYTLIVKTQTGECEYKRTAVVTVHDFPAPIILPGNDLDTYCTDGNLFLKTEDLFESYRWVIKGTSDVEVVNTTPNPDLTYKVSDIIPLAANTKLLDVHLYATDKYGCETKSPDIHTVILANPPKILEVYGLETCSDNPFTFKLYSDAKKYSIKLFDGEGAEQTLQTNISATDTTFVTEGSMPEGDYTINITDLTTGCSSDKSVHFSRYDVDVKFEFPNGIYFCQYENIDLIVKLYDKNGHADFFDKIENPVFTSQFENGELSYKALLPDLPMTSVDQAFNVDQASVSPELTPSWKLPYSLVGKLTYGFKQAVDASLSCTADIDPAKFYVLPTPKLITTPEMPVCLRTDFEFSVVTDIIDESWPEHKYVFFVNGVQVVNANGDYTSNTFKTADHPEVTLNEGDQVTAQVIVNEVGYTCVSAPIVVNYKADFKTKLSGVDSFKYHCKGSDIEYTLTSVLPDGADPSTPLVNIKSYDFYIVDNGIESLLFSVNDVNALSHTGTFSYEGDNQLILIKTVAKDENDCEIESNAVIVNIDQFKIVDVRVFNEYGTEMSNDLCADIDYKYELVFQDPAGNSIFTGSDYDFTFTMDGVEMSDHSLGNFTNDYVTYSHPVTEGEVDLVVNVKHLTTGCATDAAFDFYPPYSEPFSFHAKPDPNEKLKDSLLPVSDDVADARKFEICYNDDFGFDVNGEIVTVVYDNVKVATYRNGVVDAVHSEATLETSQITSSYADGVSVFLFDIKPSENFHTLSFIVSDGTCEVPSNEWQFRMFEDINVEVLDALGVNILVDGVATVCEGAFPKIVPSTTEPNYTKGYNFYDGADLLLSAPDFVETSYQYEAATKGEYEFKIRGDFGRNDCYKSITIRVEESPKPVVSLSNSEGADVAPESSLPLIYSFCEEEQHTLNLSGANDYQLISADRDGVDVSGEIPAASETNVLNLNYYPNENNTDYSTYTLKYQFAVVDCYETVDVILHVYNKPEAVFINGTPKSLVISGAQVPVDVTPGYDRYEFYVNDVLVQDGPNSSLPGDMNIATEETTNIKVIVHNTFGCTIVLEAVTKVLEGIDAKEIRTSADFYCTDDPGVTIYVVDPQPGLTYFVDGVPALAEIKAVDGEPVEWTPVRLTNPAIENPETFTVKAYYDALPEQIFDMANTVTVEEVKSPSDLTSVPDLKVINCVEAQSPDFSWTVSNSEADKFYTLINVTEGGSAISTPVNGTDGDLVFNIHDLMTVAYGAAKNGEYQILVQSKRQNGDFACDKVLDGVLTIDLPTTNAYTLIVTPASSNVCIDDQVFMIKLDGSDYSDEFDHEYVLFRDGVPIASVTSVPGGGQIIFEDPDRGSLAAGKYLYNVVCNFSGCVQPMANTVELNIFEHPEIFDVTAQNDGYYCYDEPDGVTITVAGSQPGFIYKLFNKGEGTLVAEELGHDDGSAIIFSNILKGDYYVEVSIPNTEGCKTLLNEVNVTEIAEPEDFMSTISEAGKIGKGGHTLVICRDHEYQINIAGADFDLTGVVIRSYELRDSEGNLISVDMDGCGTPDYVNGTFCFPVMTATTPGTFTFDVVAKSTVNLSDGTTKECEKLFNAVVELVVKDYAKTTESITVDLNPHPEIDCYGSDIIVNDPNLTVTDSVEYRLYKVDDLSGTYDVNKPISVIKPYDGDKNVFENIKDALGTYAIHANNGACDELIEIVLVENPRFAKMQELDIDEYVCEGDGGIYVKMKDSEKDVVYSIYYISPELYATINPGNGVISPTDLSENLWGVKMGDVTATFDHERLTFKDLDYGDGNITQVIYREGYYYATAVKKDVANPCPTASPLLHFEILDLPKSFDLKQSSLYCDALGSSEIFIEQSEYDPEAVITYSLWKLDDLGNATYYDEIESNPDTEKPLYFKRPVAEGTYYAIVIKKYADKYNNKICTSKMRNYITVGYAEPLDPLSFTTQTFDICAYESASYTIDEAAMSSLLSSAQAAQPIIKGINFFLTDLDVSPADETALVSKVYDGTNEITFSNLPDGVHTIWASWASDEPIDKFACLVKLGDVQVNSAPYIPTGVINATVCGTEFVLNPAYYSKDLKYILFDADGNELQTVIYDGVYVEDVRFPNLTPGNYTLHAAFVNGNACEVTMGNFTVKGIIPSTENHELLLCAETPVEYTLPASLLLDGAYYYATDKDKAPTESSFEVIRYHEGDGDVVFTQLQDGVNVIWTAFNGFGCLTAVDTVIVNRHPELPSNVVNDEVCGLTFELDNSLLINGATYTLTNTANGSVATSVVYSDAEASLSLTVLAEGTYELSIKADECQSILGKVLFRNVIDDANRIETTLSVCGAPVVFNLSDFYAGNLVEGLTYYVVDATKKPSEAKAVGQKYATGNDIVFQGLPVGEYKIWASYEGYACETELGDLHVIDRIIGITPSDENHEIVLCAEGSPEYEVPTSLLIDGAYYYLTDKVTSPTESASEIKRYHDGDAMVFTNLKDGVNVIWVAFNGFDCLTAIDTVTVTRLSDLPTNVVNAAVCGMTYEVDNAILLNGATYTLTNKADGSVATSDVYTDAAGSLALTVLAEGTYELSVKVAECGSILGEVTFRAAIDATQRIEANIAVCGGAPATFTLTDALHVDKLVEGLTYYIVEGTETPSGIMTTGRKYVAGNDITFRGLLPGNYKVWASYDGYACETEVGDVRITDADLEQIELIGFLSCENELTFSTDTSYLGVTYTLYGIDKDKNVVFTSESIEGTGNSIQWTPFEYISSANKYEVRAVAGTCPESTVAVIYSGGIRQDFDLIVANFYSQGGECNSTAPLSLVLDESVPGITYYLTVADGDPRTPYEGTVKEGDGNKLVWEIKRLGLTGTQTFHLYAYKGNLATTSCFSDNTWRSVTINLDAVSYGAGRLVARNDVIDYCAGENGIRLGYVDGPHKGEIYRLYRIDNESIWGRELVDIQEIPAYMDPSPYQPTDTLFFNGWGYNESSKEYATAGTYFVEVESEQGCRAETDTLQVVENPLPVEQTDSVFFILVDADGALDMSTRNTEFGVMGGDLVYSKAVPGKTYTLLKDGVPIPGTTTTTDVAKDLYFGPILEPVSDTITVNDTIKIVDYNVIDDLGIHWGEGVYSVLVQDQVTECTSELGNVMFVAEALTAYNVYIYLNKNEMARTVDLIPTYDAATDIAYKGNHMYIDWSSRCDRIYYPAITTSDDGYYVNDTEATASYNMSDNTNYFTKGYTNIKGSYDQTRRKFTGKEGSANVWFEVVNDPDRMISGTYGFIDVDATTNDTSHVKMSTQTGYFFYMKQPSFFGREEIQYQVANRQLPNRVSNVATITILCGNEDTGDNESVFLIPNAFSPNGDGLNDFFKIIIPDRYQANSESKLQVFNRWGTLVYRSSGLRYGEDENWWDGTSSTSNMVTLGENLPSGTYYYVFTITFIDKQHATRSERKMHGYVELRR